MEPGVTFSGYIPRAGNCRGGDLCSPGIYPEAETAQLFRVGSNSAWSPGLCPQAGTAGRLPAALRPCLRPCGPAALRPACGPAADSRILESASADFTTLAEADAR